jgi:hypothetical protein
MADVRTVFPILADAVSGAGEPAISRTEGEAAAGQAGLIGFSFKDSSGNVVLPQLTSAGAIVVDTEASNYSCLDSEGEDAAPVVDTESDLVTIALQDATVYEHMALLVSCSRWAIFRLYWVDDVGGANTESDLGYVQVGPGQMTVCCEMPCKQFTSGTTSELRLAGTAKNVSSTMRASLSVRELA